MIAEDPALAALLRERFGLFLRYAFREIGGNDQYLHNWHIDAIVHRLDQVCSGAATRLIVTMPPRHLKSITISIAWVAWMIGHNPKLRFMCVSYGQDLAEKHAFDCLRIMDSHWYRMAFPEVRLVRRSVRDFETSEGGGRMSTSIGGVATGRGADIIILDDPMKASEALSDTARETTRDWVDGTLLQRLNSQEKGAIILVMQRLHEDDPAGQMLRQGGWDELRLSAIATHDERVPVGAGRAYHRRQGHALHEARQSLAVLERIRRSNSFVFQAQYQQDPVPILGNLMKRDWLSFYDEPPTSGMMVMSMDTAAKPGLGNDYSVAVVARLHQGRTYLVDVWRGKVGFGPLLERLKDLCRHHQVERLLIEDASSGIQLLQLLRQQLPPGVPYPLGIHPQGDKISRFGAAAARIEAGELVLPRVAPWLAEFIHEIVAFPSGRYDDQADALAQLLNHPPPVQDDTPLAGPIEVPEDDGFDYVGLATLPSFEDAYCDFYSLVANQR